MRRLKQLDDENLKLKQLVAELSLDKHIPQEPMKACGDLALQMLDKLQALPAAPAMPKP